MGSISLSMIVKNEEKYLEGCLESVKDVVDEIVIVDTGSTDRTKQIALQYDAIIHDFTWVNDFSVARNYAKTKCSGDWILYLDADERLDPLSKKEIHNIVSSNHKAGYFCQVLSIDNETGRDHSIKYTRLFPNHPQIIFVGKVHEQIQPSLIQNGLPLLNSEILINHIGYNISKAEKQNKARRNLNLLLQDYDKNKSDYLAYQLGLTYQTLDEMDNACKYFKIAGSSNKLDKELKALCYSSLAFIAHRNQKVQEAEKYIFDSIKLDDKQPFSQLLAAKILLRKSDLIGAEKQCKQSFVLNKGLFNNKNHSLTSVYINPEEIIYFGMMLAYQHSNDTNYQFYQNELYSHYDKLSGSKNSIKSVVLNKLLSNIPLSSKEEDVLVNISDKNNLGFFIFALTNYPDAQKKLNLAEKLFHKFPDEAETGKFVAKLYADLGNYQNSIIILEKLITIGNDDPAIYFYLLTYYLNIGQIEKLKSIVTQLEKKFPHIPEVITRINILKQKLFLTAN